MSFNNLNERDIFFMNINWFMLFIAINAIFILAFSRLQIFFKSRKRSAESIYKLIEDLEKKYIF